MVLNGLHVCIGISGQFNVLKAPTSRGPRPKRRHQRKNWPPEHDALNETIILWTIRIAVMSHTIWWQWR